MPIIPLSYFFQLLGLVFVLSAGIHKQQNRILFLTFCANLCSTVVMILAGRFDGAAATIVATIRAFLFLQRDRARDNRIFWCCTVAHALVGVITWQSPLSLLIFAAPLILCLTGWFGTVRQIKWGIIASDLCWVIFDLVNGIYIEAGRDIGEILSNIAGLVRLKGVKTPGEQS